MKKSKLVIGISSRALFDLDESHKIFERDGVDAYREYQILNGPPVGLPRHAASGRAHFWDGSSRQ